MQADRKRDGVSVGVAAGLKPFTVVRQVQRLQAERRKGGVAAADAGHEKLPRIAAGEDAAIRTGQRGEKADDE